MGLVPCRLLGERVSFSLPQMCGGCHRPGVATKPKSPNDDVVKSLVRPCHAWAVTGSGSHFCCSSQAAAALEVSPWASTCEGRRTLDHSFLYVCFKKKKILYGHPYAYILEYSVMTIQGVIITWQHSLLQMSFDHQKKNLFKRKYSFEQNLSFFILFLN